MKPVWAATSICDAIFSTFKVIRKLKTCTSIIANGNLRVRVGWLGSGLFEDVCRPRYNDRTFHFPLPTGNLFATLRGGVEKKIKCRLPESLNKLSMFSQPQLHLQQKIAIYQTQTGWLQPFFVVDIFSVSYDNKAMLTFPSSSINSLIWECVNLITVVCTFSVWISTVKVKLSWRLDIYMQL